MSPRKAYSVVKHAIASGVLIRPHKCSKCGETPTPASDGRSRIHAHHHDYDKPLEVEWLCAKCHRAETPLPEKIGGPAYGDANGMRRFKGLLTGSRNGFSKLTEASAAEIKASRHMTAKQLAEKHNVKIGTINDVRNGRTWSHVSAAAPQTGDKP